jgi:hypothetical protein
LAAFTEGLGDGAISKAHSAGFSWTTLRMRRTTRIPSACASRFSFSSSRSETACAIADPSGVAQETKVRRRHRPVVDVVADHQHALAGVLRRPDQAQLVLRPEPARRRVMESWWETFCTTSGWFSLAMATSTPICCRLTTPDLYAER